MSEPLTSGRRWAFRLSGIAIEDAADLVEAGALGQSPPLCVQVGRHAQGAFLRGEQGDLAALARHAQQLRLVASRAAESADRNRVVSLFKQAWCFAVLDVEAAPDPSVPRAAAERLLRLGDELSEVGLATLTLIRDGFALDEAYETARRSLE